MRQMISLGRGHSHSLGKIALLAVLVTALLVAPFAGVAAAYGADDVTGGTHIADETVTVTENTTTLSVSLEYVDEVDAEASDVYVQVFDSDGVEVDNETAVPADNGSDSFEWDVATAGFETDDDVSVVISTDDDNATDSVDFWSIELLDDGGDVLESVDSEAAGGGSGGSGGLIDGVSNTALAVAGLIVVLFVYLRD